ncbi:MAG TPA: hypothetical protein VGP93_11165, partial [Polyangiaceae bacterium]|nr:hypothetical protein [Polyangiaceae bacterium]
MTAINMPSACDALTTTGVWEDIHPADATDTTSVVVDPFDSAIVWAAGSHKGFFKSTDCGASWTKISTGTNASIINNGSGWSVAIDPVDQGTIYLVGAYGALGLWKSTNGGVDFTQVFTPDTEFAQVASENFVNNISMDPNNHLHLVVMEHGTCTGYSPDCEAESTDGGDSWKLTATPQGWGEGGGLYLINATTWVWGGSEGSTGTYVTTNNGSSWTKASNESANG